MTCPGVGTVVASSAVTAVDDPARFAEAKAVGPARGPTPRPSRSEEADRPGAVTKGSDERARVTLFEAAHGMPTLVAARFRLEARAMRVATGRGTERVEVALARRPAVILPHMWIDGTEVQAVPTCRKPGTDELLSAEKRSPLRTMAEDEPQDTSPLDPRSFDDVVSERGCLCQRRSQQGIAETSG